MGRKERRPGWSRYKNTRHRGFPAHLNKTRSAGRSRPDAIEVRWPFAAHQTGTLAIQRATTRHGGPLTYNKLRALIAGCLEVDLGRVTDNAQLSRDLGADRLDRLELMTLVEEITGVEITDDELYQIEVI